MHLGDETSKDPEDKDNLFYNYFSSVHDNNSNSYNIFDPNDTSNNQTAPFTINYNDIVKAVEQLNNKGGFGSDGIPNVFIKNCVYSLLEPLMLIFNDSLSSNVFPNIWKQSLITPVFKNGNKQNISNYRPISIICTFLKLFESIFYTKLYENIKDHISQYQHGFVKGLSILTNLSVFSDYVTNSIESKRQVDVVYTDFSKAFDKILCTKCTKKHIKKSK